MERGRVRVRPKGVAALRSGRPWVYRGDIGAVEGGPSPGDVVLLCDMQDRALGQAFYHDRSVLAARLLTDDPDETIDARFLQERLHRAIAYRDAVCPEQPCRLVFSEADGLPGLIVDRLDDVLVVQVTSAGMEQRLTLVCDALAELTGLGRIFERNDAAVRALENLPQRVGALRGDPPERLFIREGAVRMEIDLRHGAKTGHFLDQRDNRALFGWLVSRLFRGGDGGGDMIHPRPAYGLDPGAGPDIRVLDAFSHTGGFGLQALAAGARNVTFVESSPVAAEGVHRNLEANGYVGGRVLAGNAFDVLRDLEGGGARFEAVVLDPPAFARGRRQLDGAYRGYKDINLRAMRLLAAGGILCTSSCSQPVTETMFGEMLADAAGDAGRRLRVIARRGPGPDHPGLLGAEDTAYLQCWFLQAVD